MQVLLLGSVIWSAGTGATGGCNFTLLKLDPSEEKWQIVSALSLEQTVEVASFLVVFSSRERQ